MADPYQLIKKKESDWPRADRVSLTHLELEVVHHLVADGREEELLVLRHPLGHVVEHRLRRHLDKSFRFLFLDEKHKNFGSGPKTSQTTEKLVFDPRRQKKIRRKL